MRAERKLRKTYLGCIMHRRGSIIVGMHHHSDKKTITVNERKDSRATQILGSAISYRHRLSGNKYCTKDHSIFICPKINRLMLCAVCRLVGVSIPRKKGWVALKELEAAL